MSNSSLELGQPIVEKDKTEIRDNDEKHLYQILTIKCHLIAWRYKTSSKRDNQTFILDGKLNVLNAIIDGVEVIFNLCIL